MCLPYFDDKHEVICLVGGEGRILVESLSPSDPDCLLQATLCDFAVSHQRAGGLMSGATVGAK
jgi:hypothetical protein